MAAEPLTPSSLEVGVGERERIHDLLCHKKFQVLTGFVTKPTVLFCTQRVFRGFKSRKVAQEERDQELVFIGMQKQVLSPPL